MNFRKATLDDLPFIIAMLADDILGSKREEYRKPLPQSYVDAFNSISTDPNQELIVIENETSEIIGTLQLTFIRYLNYQGGLRVQIESVRIRSDYRGTGIGKTFIKWAIERAKNKNARIIQLTTDKQRPKAIKFYKDLGFNPSHEGMKMHLK